MGYTTEFTGRIHINPPLSMGEIAYLDKFIQTRRMDRKKGPYFVDGSGVCGQGHDADINNYNSPPAGQPGLWCQWAPTDGGKTIEWDGGEKFYNGVEWMTYIIDHFLSPDAKIKSGRHKKNFEKYNSHILFGDHICNGIITAQGEDEDDRWTLAVHDNKVFQFEGHHEPVT